MQLLKQHSLCYKRLLRGYFKTVLLRGRLLFTLSDFHRVNRYHVHSRCYCFWMTSHESKVWRGLPRDSHNSHLMILEFVCSFLWIFWNSVRILNLLALLCFFTPVPNVCLWPLQCFHCDFFKLFLTNGEGILRTVVLLEDPVNFPADFTLQYFWKNNKNLFPPNASWHLFSEVHYYYFHQKITTDAANPMLHS